MSIFRSGEVVSLSRAQTSIVDILSPVPALASVDLPINGVARTFSLDLPDGTTLADAASLFAALLEDQQTVYSVAADGLVPGRLVVVGQLGESFEVGTVGCTHTLFESAVLGFPVRGKLIVILAESLYGTPPREFATRVEPTKVVEERNVLSVRELNTGNTFEIDSRRVLTRGLSQ